MVQKGFVLLTLLLLQYAHGRYLYDTQTEFHLKNRFMEIRVSKQTGDITAIVTRDKNLLSRESTIDIDISSHEDKGKIVAAEGKDYYPKFARISFRKEWTGVSLVQTFLIDSLALRWEVEVLSNIGIEREATLGFKIPIVGEMSHLFYPGQDAVFRLREISKQIRTYRQSFLIPMFCVYNTTEDYGVSVIAPFEIPKPGLDFSIDDRNVVVTYNHLRLTDHGKINAAVYLVPHKGGWRPGLSFLLSRYPEYFYPAVENTKVGEGWYHLGNPADDENKIVQVKQQGVEWFELHGHFPFYGLYAPKPEEWRIIMNSDEISLDNWEKGAGKRRNGYERMYNQISLWHKHGVQTYLYFQGFEAWHQYAEKYFAEDIARNKRDEPHSAWKLCNLLNPDPAGEWGKYVINQAEDLIKRYPMIDGIFYDRLDYWNYDFAHDDGVTMIDDQPVYMLGFALEKINRTVLDIFHKHKKGVWGNIPTSIEVCQNLDGIMAEIRPSTLHKIQYLGLVRPIIYLPKDTAAEETENKLKNALLCGAFPSITYGGKECRDLDDKYRPLFDIIYNREWVLTPNPLSIPTWLMGNIYKTPEGDYAVFITDAKKSQLPPHPFGYNIPITINVPNAHEIEYVYLLSGDWRGINAIDFERQGNSLRMKLPYHLSSSLLHLRRKKYKGATRLSSPLLIKGRNEDIEFRLDNVDFLGFTAVTLKTPWSKQTKIITKETVKFHTKVPIDIEGEIDMTITCNGRKERLSSWVVDPISIAPKENIFIKFNKGEYIPFYITNNSGSTVAIGIKSTFSKGNGSIKAPDEFVLRPLESREIELLISAKDEGEIQVTIEVEQDRIVKTFPIKTGTAFSSDDLFHDDFSSNMDKWIVKKGKWHVIDHIAQSSGQAHFAVVENNWKNFVYEVRTRIKGSTNASVYWLKSYIFFRLQDEMNFYRFGIHGDAGVIDLYKRINGGWYRLGSSVFAPEENRWYVLTISVEGAKILGYIDGKKIVEASDRAFSSGGIGIGVLEDGMMCDYKDVIVRKL